MPGLAADTLIEGIEGPVQIGTLAGKSVPGLTRLPNGSFGFRRLAVTKAAENAPVVRIMLSNGLAVTAARDQVFIRKGGVEGVLAQDLKAGDPLEPSWVFLEGYTSPYAADSPSEACYRVVAVEAAGHAEVFLASVRETGRFYLTCGVLCRDAPPSGSGKAAAARASKKG